MARVLIIGCGCRGRALAGALVADGHAVRGTTRDPGATGAIRAAGAEPAVADPDRVGTLVPALEGVAVACWLLGSARGDADALGELHGSRFRAFLEKVVDTGVRGVIYESSGSVDPALLAAGSRELERAGHVWRIPSVALDADPREAEPWTRAAQAAVAGLLG